MKRTLLLSWILALAPPAFCQPVANVKSVRGDVSIKLAAGKEFAEVKAGQALSIGDFLATDVDSEAILSFPQGAEVKVAELTQLRINEAFLSPDRNRLQLFLKTGKLETSTAAAPLARTGFSVSTPVATASIRGSHQRVTHHAGFGTRVEFLKGFGFTSSAAGQTIAQAAGQKSRVEIGGGVSGPQATAKRASRPALLSAGHDDSEQSAAGDSGALSDRTSNDPASPNKLGGSVGSSSSPALLRIRIERFP